MISRICRKAGVLSAVALPVLLGGCALPVPLQIASWAIDGISFIVTEKSVADHGISAALDKDCALLRTVTEGQTCRDGSSFQITMREEFRHLQDDGELTVDGVAWADTDLDGFDVSLDGDAPASPVAWADTDLNAFEDAPVPARVAAKADPAPPAAPAPQVRGGANLFYVIGSFSRSERAHRLAARYADLTPSVMPVKIRSQKQVFRVLVGPYAQDEMREAGQRLQAHGVRHAWGVRIDPGDWQAARLDPAHPQPKGEDSPSVAALR